MKVQPILCTVLQLRKVCLRYWNKDVKVRADESGAFWMVSIAAIGDT